MPQAIPPAKRPTLEDMLRARHRLRHHLAPTPLVQAPALSALTGHAAWLKLETVQPTRSFKVRGALNAALELLDRRGRPAPLLVTASAGNHGIALAYAGSVLDLETTIFTAKSAPRAKLDAIRRLTPGLRAEAPDYDAAERLAQDTAAEGGLVYVSPYDDGDVIAGAGTTALEMYDDVPRIGTILVPVGGGGLLSGIAIVAKALSPSARVVGVEAEQNPAFRTSLAAGKITQMTPGPTIADGLAGNLAERAITFDIVRELVDDMVAVSEPEIAAGIRFLLAEEHCLAEAAGAVTTAALLAGKVPAAPGATIAVVSGANIDLAPLMGACREAAP